MGLSCLISERDGGYSRLSSTCFANVPTFSDGRLWNGLLLAPIYGAVMPTLPPGFSANLCEFFLERLDNIDLKMA